MDRFMLGKTGLKVSAVGFGGIPIQRISFQAADSLVRRSIDLGVNFFDTAAGYGDSQKKIGQVMEDRRSEVVLATKSPAKKRIQMQEHLETALDELRTDHIDLFQLHGVNDKDKWQSMIDGPLEFLMEAREQGKVGHIGFSSHSHDMATEIIKENDDMETVQFPFNLVTSEAADELIPLAREKNVGFIVMKPLCGGQFSNAELAFKFLNSYPDLVAIPGIEKAEEIEQIAELVSSRVELSGDEQKKAREVADELGKHFCRRCGYCEPCPEGVPVGLSMIFDSMIARVPRQKLVDGPARRLLQRAGNCIECGECEKKCPYDLPIIDGVRSSYEKALNISES